MHSVGWQSNKHWVGEVPLRQVTLEAKLCSHQQLVVKAMIKNGGAWLHHPCTTIQCNDMKEKALKVEAELAIFCNHWRSDQDTCIITKISMLDSL